MVRPSEFLISLVILGTIIPAVIQGCSAFVKVYRNLYTISEDTLSNYEISFNTIIIVSFLSIFMISFGFNIMLFFPLLYLNYLFKYLFFQRNRYNDFYDNLKICYKYLRILRWIMAILAMITMAISLFQWDIANT